MKKGWFFIGLLISLILLFVLLSQVSVFEVFNVLRMVSLDVVLIAFLIYILIYVLRSVRFMTLLNGKIKFFRLFNIVCLHNLANLVMPMRSGEVSYVYFAKKEGIDSSVGIATLILARIFDFVSILFIFVLGYFYMENLPNSVLDALIWFLVLVFLLLSILVGLIVFKMNLKIVFEKILKIFSLEKNKLVVIFQKKLGLVVDVFRDVGFNKIVLLVLIESLVLWGLMFYFTYFVLIGFGLDLSIVEMMIGGSISLLLLMLPVQGILGFGTTEAAFTIAFLILGFEKNLIIAVGFGYHILSLVFGIILGVYGALSYKYFVKKYG